MLRVVCLALIVATALANKPLAGSAECHHVLAADCSGFSYEPVCTHLGHDGTRTIDNSCEFAKALCNHHGHQVHAEHIGECH